MVSGQLREWWCLLHESTGPPSSAVFALFDRQNAGRVTEDGRTFRCPQVHFEALRRHQKPVWQFSRAFRALRNEQKKTQKFSTSSRTLERSPDDTINPCKRVGDLPNQTSSRCAFSYSGVAFLGVSRLLFRFLFIDDVLPIESDAATGFALAAAVIDIQI